MLGIITGTIRPDKNVGRLMLKDADERWKQYKESIEFYIHSRAFKQIIFCDNSDYDMQELEVLAEDAKEKGITLELLSFQGNAEGVVAHGKGYGEGEIMQYIMTHSKLMKTAPFFVKITGRLKVTNISKITPKLKKDNIYFNIPNVTRRDIYDTRMYAMKTEVFRKYFENAYDRVFDDRGIFLEHVYTDILVHHRMKIKNFPCYPRIIGLSGSNGIVYGYTEWKCKIKDILSQVDFYKVKEKR